MLLQVNQLPVRWHELVKNMFRWVKSTECFTLRWLIKRDWAAMQGIVFQMFVWKNLKIIYPFHFNSQLQIPMKYTEVWNYNLRKLEKFSFQSTTINSVGPY